MDLSINSTKLAGRLTQFKAHPVLEKLGTDHTRPMGLASHIRVSTRVDPDPLAGKTNATDKLLNRGAGDDLTGDQRTIGQGCNSGDNAVQRGLCLTNFSGGKKGRGTEASDKPEEPQYLCTSRPLQNGGSSHPSRPHPSSGLDDKNGLEGCLPSGTHPPAVPTPSPVSMEQESLSVSMPSIRADISTTGFLKGDETCSGDPKTYGHSADYLPGRYSYITPGKGGAYSGYSTNLPVLQDTGAGDQPEEINFDSQQRIEFLGFLVDATTLHLVFPAEKLRKVQQLAQHLLCQQTVSVRELARFVGKTSASQRAIWQAPLHYRALQFLINSVVPTSPHRRVRMRNSIPT